MSTSRVVVSASERLSLMYCGFSEAVRRRRTVVVLQVNLDESYGHNTFVMAGYAARPDKWAEFIPAWAHLLEEINGGLPLHMNHVAAHWIKRGVFNERCARIQALIDEHCELAVSLSVDVKALKRVFAEEFVERQSPYVFCLTQIMGQLLQREDLDSDGKIDFVFDKTSQAKTVNRIWEAFISAGPPIARERLVRPPFFELDDEWSPLQAADFRAWRFHRLFEQDEESPRAISPLPSRLPSPGRFFGEPELVELADQYRFWSAAVEALPDH